VRLAELWRDSVSLYALCPRGLGMKENRQAQPSIGAFHTE
jgi:hypothetical protein